ncbi:MAG: DUF3488 and transglutaminase-like domain-containing protein [Methylococcales bacterium]
MKLNSNQRILVFLLVSIGLITLPHINHIPLTIFIIFNACLAWRFVCVWKINLLPNKFVLFILMVVSVFLFYQQYHSFLGRDAGTGFFVIALGLKLLEVNKTRDIYLVNYLAFIVATSQFLYQQSILMAVYILIVSCVLLATLVSINSQIPKTFAALKTASIILVQALPITIILFVLFPRVQAPRWMLFNQQHTAKTGLSDSLEPGAISRLGLSDELVFRAKFKGQRPPQNKLYWRGPVYSYTNGNRWAELKKSKTNAIVNTINYSGKAYQYTLLMEPQDKKWVYALEMPLIFPQKLKKNFQYQLIDSENINKRAEYKLTSYTQYNTGTISDKERGQNLQLPEKPSARLKQLVTQLHGFARPAEVFIQAVLNYFREENFHYTLSPPLMGETPIETFLFEKRYGFCSHYATAFVYLMRIAGIPSRVIGGYQGGELNQAGDFLEIRQANAHAWAEVWLKNKGWTRFDPTAAIAPERIEKNVNIDLQIATGIINFSAMYTDGSRTLSWMKQSRQMWSNIDYSWQRWVINYSTENQTKFLSSLGINNLKSVVYWLAGSIGFIIAILAGFILRQQTSKQAEEVRIYQLFCKKMTKVGFNKKTAETVQHFAQRIAQSRPDLAEKVNKITQTYSRLRYEKEPSSKEILQLTKQVKELKVTDFSRFNHILPDYP